MIHNNNENPTLEQIIMSAISEALSNVHTSLIAKITKVNKTTINVKPVISRVVDGKKIDLPEFANVPIINFLGGSSSIQMPIKKGDYCKLFVNERCFDSWYAGADFKEPLEQRLHDYSDTVALVGLKNETSELDIPEDITITGDVEHKGDLHITGDLHVDGNIICDGDVTISGISFLGHTHSGDSGGTTGTPQ